MVELGLGFDNLFKPEYLNIRSVTNGSFADGGINAKFPNEIHIKNLQLSSVNRVVIGNLNFNSMPNKFNQLKELVLKYVDILVLTEKKLEDSF